ncbi:MAG: hypothetical protein ACSW8J_04580, partial [bacterium]
EAHLILEDGAALTIPKGITVTGSNRLTIYGQSAGTGALTIDSPDDNNAAIGGNSNQSGGNITVNGGAVSATGGWGAAGIGGGYGGAGGNITINGGKITANGNLGCAGIGGGYGGAGGNITINGGAVTATGGQFGAGIGGGYEGAGGTITIGKGVSVMAGNDETSATDVTATFATTHNQLWVHTTYTAPQFATAALELNGVLNLRFYVEYPANWDGADDKVTFTVSGKGARTIDVAYANRGTDTNGTYFACPVYAYEMNDKITATYYNGSEAVDSLDYTVRQNLEYLAENATGNALALAQAAMNFGHYIQPYLAGLNGWTVGTDHVAMPAYGSISAANNPAAEGYDHTWNTRTDDVASASYYLTLNDTTTLNVVVKLNSAPTGDVTASADGKTVTPEDVGGNSYLISLPGIPANGLHLPYAFTLSVGGTKVFDLRISGLSYVNLVYANGNPTDVEKQALTALYNYAIAANNYAAN